MLIPQFVISMFSIGLIVLGAGMVSGQDYPNKPLRIHTSEPGSSTDFAARLIAQGISTGLRQNVVVENRPSNLLGEVVAKAPPDGYTLLAAGGTFMMGPLLQKMSYDPIRDFSPITLAVTSPNVLVVHPSLPVKSVKELIALAKARPGKLNYASAASGSSTHLAGALFNAMANVNMVWVPYKGSGPAVIALISGEVHMMITSASSAMGHVKSGKLRVLAVTSAQPSPLVSGLPTVAATGLPGYEWVAIIGMFTPAKTPVPVINRLNQEIVRVLNQADIKEKFLNTGAEVVASSPEQLADTVKSEITRMDKVIKDAGIRGE